MLIGQATLKSAAFCPRLTLLIADFRRAGYTVWLEGLDLRFDRTDGPTHAQPGDLSALMERYRDIVDWGPRTFAEAAPPAALLQPSTPARWLQRLSGRGIDVKAG